MDMGGFLPPVDAPAAPSFPLPQDEYIQGLLGQGQSPPSFNEMGLGPPEQQPDPGPAFIDVPPPPPEQEFIDAVWDYMPELLSHSREVIKGYEDKWDKWLKLWKDELTLQEWRFWPRKQSEAVDNTRSGITSDSAAIDDVWESGYVHSPGYQVDQYADRAYPMIFGGPEFFTILCQDATQINSESEFPTNRKIQEYMLRLLLQGKIHARTYECLFLWPLIGSVFAKVSWYEHIVPKWQQSTTTGNTYETDEVLYECPIIEPIPPDRILIDPKAINNNTQTWRFVGHRIDMTYDQIIEGYETGLFDLNRDKFEERWKPKGGSEATEENRSILQDDDLVDVEPSDDTTVCELWEWHGKVPYKGRLRESWGVICTNLDAESCKDGLQIRVSQAPLLRATGQRPIVCSHFQQYPGPLGLGLFDRQEKILYTISQLVAQFEDCAKLTCNPMYEGGPGFIREMQKQGGKVRPGGVIPRTLGEQPPTQMAPLHFPAEQIQNLIQYLEGWSSRRSTVMDSWIGAQGNADTATAAQIQQQQGQAPAATKTDLFTRDFFEPLLNLALAWIQQLSFDDKLIAFVGADGSPQQETVTEDEIRNGRYVAVATLTRQDSNSMAKAQSVERIIPILQNLEQNLTNEGAAVSFTEIIKRYADLIGVEGSDRIVRVLSSREQVLMQQVQDLIGRLQALSEQQGPPPKGNGTPEAPPQNAPNPELQQGASGGPMGPVPSDANQMALDLQTQAIDNNPEVY